LGAFEHRRISGELVNLAIAGLISGGFLERQREFLPGFRDIHPHVRNFDPASRTISGIRAKGEIPWRPGAAPARNAESLFFLRSAKVIKLGANPNPF
jgi:hypothetical protein